MRAPRPIDIALLVLLAAGPAIAQQPAAPQGDPPNVAPNATAIGLPIYSSDGEKLGEVTQVGTTGGRPAVLADIAASLGLGPRTVIIPATMFQQKGDRVELVMTASEVRDSLSRQEQQDR